MKSRIDKALICALKAIEKQSEVTKGVKIEGQKVSYAEALKDIQRMTTFFQFHHTKGKGCCGECCEFTIRGHQSQYGEFGTCKKWSKTVHWFDSCDKQDEIPF